MTDAAVNVLERAGALAGSVLTERLGREARVEGVRLLKDETRTVVARGRVVGGGPGLGSLILKLLRDDAATGFSEWASLAFLAELPGAAELVPGFLGGDVPGRLLLIEDLGPGRTLHELLTQGSRKEAEAALAQLAGQMARLHAATLGQEQRFDIIRKALPGADAVGRRREAEAWLGARGRVVAWLDATGYPAPAGLDAATAAVAAAYAEPGEWLCFTHGDPAPSNNHFAGGAARLLDFEYGAFRHALYDITAWDVLCPLPRPAVALMRRAFQHALAERLPIAADEGAFAAAWAVLCAYRGLAMLTWVPPSVLEADRPMVGDWTAREAVLAAVTRTAQAAAAAPALAPIAEVTAALSAALAARWPELGAPGELATRWAALEREPGATN